MIEEIFSRKSIVTVDILDISPFPTAEHKKVFDDAGTRRWVERCYKYQVESWHRWSTQKQNTRGQLQLTIDWGDLEKIQRDTTSNKNMEGRREHRKYNPPQLALDTPYLGRKWVLMMEVREKATLKDVLQVLCNICCATGWAVLDLGWFFWTRWWYMKTRGQRPEIDTESNALSVSLSCSAGIGLLATDQSQRRTQSPLCPW